MSFRNLPNLDKALSELLRSFADRIYKLEHGGAIAGIVSFGDHIIIGGVDLTVDDTGGGHKRLTFTNPDNGLTSIINL